jgi:hypothetical protein
MAPAVIGFMLASGMGQYVLYTFALTYLIASFAVIAIGIETKGMVLEQITGVDGPSGVVSAVPSAVKA